MDMQNKGRNVRRANNEMKPTTVEDPLIVY